MVFCTKCRKKSDEGKRFCIACGNQLPTTPTPDSSKLELAKLPKLPVEGDLDENELFKWAQYEAAKCGYNVENWTTHWKDGLAFCCIIHISRGDLIGRIDELPVDRPAENIKLAISSSKKLGIEPCIIVDDILGPSEPPKEKVISFVKQLYFVFGEGQVRMIPSRPSSRRNSTQTDQQEKERIQLEKEKNQKEQQEKERIQQEQERIQKEQQEKEKIQQEQQEKERIQKEQQEKERLQKEQQERERIQQEQEKSIKDQVEKERVQKEQQEKVIKDQEQEKSKQEMKICIVFKPAPFMKERCVVCNLLAEAHVQRPVTPPLSGVSTIKKPPPLPDKSNAPPLPKKTPPPPLPEKPKEIPLPQESKDLSEKPKAPPLPEKPKEIPLLLKTKEAPKPFIPVKAPPPLPPKEKVETEKNHAAPLGEKSWSAGILPQSKIRFCINCGKEMNSAAVFCSKCGFNNKVSLPPSSRDSAPQTGTSRSQIFQRETSNPETVPEPVPEMKVKKRRSLVLSKELTTFNAKSAQQRCDKCQENLPYNEDIVSFKSKLFHQKCFRCHICNCNFSPTSVYYEKRGQPYCEKDFFGSGGKDSSDAKGGRCANCSKPLGDEFVQVHNTFWHTNCFNCTMCSRKFHGLKSCLWIDQQPYCDGCGRKAFVLSYSKRRQQNKT